MINPDLRRQLVRHLKGGMAFIPLDTFIYDIPYDKTGLIPDGLPYSLWQQLYHLKFAQKDILEFSIKPEYKAPSWPDAYWPENPQPKDEEEWKAAIDEYFTDRDRLEAIILDESIDLSESFVHDPSKNLIREVLLVIEHNAYHIGQMVLLARVLGIFKQARRSTSP